MSDWISVEDRLPDKRGERILCYSKEEGVVTATNMASLGFIESIVSNNLSVEMRHQDITHWMPLPEPPNV